MTDATLPATLLPLLTAGLGFLAVVAYSKRAKLRRLPVRAQKRRQP